MISSVAWKECLRGWERVCTVVTVEVGVTLWFKQSKNGQSTWIDATLMTTNEAVKTSLPEMTAQRGSQFEILLTSVLAAPWSLLG